MRRKISTTVYLTPEQHERLQQLHASTKVPMAEFIRQGVEYVLSRELLREMKERARAASEEPPPPRYVGARR